jgi:hypothetical protein
MTRHLVCCSAMPPAMVALLILAGAAPPAATGAPDAGDVGLMYGPGYTFWIKPPTGWVLDTASGQVDGLDAVFYPVGGSWRSSPIVMYASVLRKNDRETLTTAIARDVARSKADSPGVTVTALKSLPTSDKERAEVRSFAGEKTGGSEEIAYVDAGSVVAILVVDARAGSHIEEVRSAFEQLVRSYSFLTSNVKVDANK